MTVWPRLHLAGEGHVKKDKNSISPTVTSRFCLYCAPCFSNIFSAQIWFDKSYILFCNFETHPSELRLYRKIIGARWYLKGYEAEFGKLDPAAGEFLSARDASGHGTHTSSTAAGVPVENTSFMGLAKGSARGGAPSAWLAVYKVCWSTGICSSIDLLAAFDDAIHDGVDVLSISLGSSPPLDSYVEDVLAIGPFHAVAKGISVVFSAGNSGPYPQTVINTPPWVLTVAASTIDRAFPTKITLGNNQTLVVLSSLLLSHKFIIFNH